MPTRSAGCFACRRRKIRCDQARPGCKRCVTHGIECPGYRSDAGKTFNVIIYQASSEGDLQRASTGQYRPEIDRKPSDASSGSTSTGTVPSQSPPSSLPQWVDSAPQNRLQAVSVAMAKLVPSGEFPVVPLDLMDISPFYFMEIRQPVLVKAMDTLALVQLGTSFKDQGLLMQAQRSYGTTLRTLMQTISRLPAGRFWDEQIASAVLIVALSGTFNYLHQESNYIRHGVGLKQLLQMRGPRPIRTEFEASVFLQAKAIMLYHSASMKQTCFLEEPAWMAVSKGAPGRDEMWDLLDIGTRLPGILERANIALQGSDAFQIYISASELGSFLQEMDDFTARNTYPFCSAEHPTLDIDDFPAFSFWLEGDRTFPDPYEFADWRQVHLTNNAELYRATALNTLIHVIQADCRLNNLPADVYEMEHDLDTAVAALCRMLPSLVGQFPSSMGMISCSPILRLAIVHFTRRGKPKELAWAERIAAKLNEEGIAFAGPELW